MTVPTETPRATAVRTIAVDHIVAGVLEDVAAREAQVSFQEIKARSRSRALPAPRDARAALLAPGCTVITELKRAVPYRGEISELDSSAAMAALARDLEGAGVGLIGVQTDSRRFHGSLEEMRIVREATSIPMICRDIIVDPYQIHEARCFGADMVPLQVELMGQHRLVSLLDRIESLGMTALLEVRNPEEADRALAAGGSVLGINAWSLASDELYRAAFADIVPGLPEEIIKIAVGGVETTQDLLRYASLGADAVLAGESIVAGTDPIGLARSLVALGKHPACPSRKA